MLGDEIVSLDLLVQMWVLVHFDALHISLLYQIVHPESIHWANQ